MLIKKIKTRIILIFCSALFVLIGFADFAYGCRCITEETVDIEFKNTPNVLILRLQNVELLAEKSKGGGDIRSYTFVTEKVFKGNLKVNDKLIFRNEYPSCNGIFSEKDVGTKYLFYSEEPDKEGIWKVPSCSSRSGLLNRVAADLLYLENIENVLNKTRLSGSVIQYFQQMTEDGKSRKLDYLVGRKIRIVGNGKAIELKTDENGVYEIYDLPPGKYTVTLEKINGYSFTYDNSDSKEVEIKAKSHTEEIFFYSINNAIRGKLYDTYGKPLKDVSLELIPANKDFNFYIDETSTDENGNFKFESIPAGTYLIVVNSLGKISSKEPFRTFYYPAAIKREEASEITIDAGVFYENLIVKAPQMAEVIVVSGTLLFEDGTPVVKESVEFIAETEDPESGYNYSESAQTDEKGRFTIKIIKGQSGNLFGEFYTYEGEFTDCPQIEKLLDKSRGTTIIKTSPKKIDAIENLSGIELKFPFNSCKKKD